MQEPLTAALGRLDRPYLRFLVADSDVWAYELCTGDGVVSAFASRPGMYSDLPDGPNDLAAFVATLRLSRRPADLARIQRRRAVFAEQPAEAFLAAIGVPAAATQYDYVLANEIEAPGFAKTELRYRRPGFDPMAGFNLHLIEPRPEPPLPPDAEEASRELAARLGSPQVAAMLAFARVLGVVFRVLFWVARPWLRWRMRSRLQPGRPNAGPAAQETAGAPVLRGAILEAPRLGFRLTLPAGVEGPQGLRIFRWRGLDVSVRVDPPERVRLVLSSSQGPARLLSRNLFFGPLAAKAIVHEGKGPGEGVVRTLAVHVASDRGVYTFHARAPHDQAQPTLEQLEELVAPLSTFELIEVERSTAEDR